MLCPNCGSQNGFIAKFCQCCGKDLRATSMASASRRSYAGFGRRFAAYLQDNALVYMGMGLSIFVLDLIFAPTAVG
jgi:predicted amidophosphoribosyltransferase